MKKKYETVIPIPEGIECNFTAGVFRCQSGIIAIEKRFVLPKTEVLIEEGFVKMRSTKANRSLISYIETYAAHIRNMFMGLERPFEYRLEICNVHFPMTCKVMGRKFIISNFLGEKKTREAVILPDATVEINGNEISVKAHNLESAGQTAANIEKASAISKRDRRVFQDGIFIVAKPESAR